MTTTFLSTDSIDASQLRELLHDRATRILDVRTGGEFATAHIPGSYNVPLDTLSEHADDFAELEHPVVLVCQSGVRATRAHQELSAAGKNTLHILDGGMTAWQATGGDVTYGEDTTWAMDRQVRFVAGSIAIAGIGLSTIVPGAKWIAGGVGAGLTWSGISNTCTMANILAKLPYNNRTDTGDIDTVLAQLKRVQP